MPTTWLPPAGWRVSRIAWAGGSAVRRAYAAALPHLVDRPLRPPRELPYDVLSFSCQRDLPEQVASLRSLLGRAGRPGRATVVSDGSHTASGRALLERLDPCVRVVDWRDVARPDLPHPVRAYAQASPMGKKLAVEVSLPPDRPLLYVDSDVLVLPDGGERLAAELEAAHARGTPAYLLDPEEVYLDPRLLEPGESAQPLNAGLLVLPRALDWEPALRRLAAMQGPPAFHTEQTLVHLAVRAAGGRPLDPDRWVVATDDMPDRRDRHRGPEVVVRHYTTPVRHKLWLCVLSTGLSAAAPSAALPPSPAAARPGSSAP